MTQFNRDRAAWLAGRSPLMHSQIEEMQAQLKAALHEIVNLESAMRFIHANMAAIMDSAGEGPQARAMRLTDEGG